MRKQRERTPDAQYATFKRQAVTVANNLQKSLTGDFAEIQRLLDGHPIAFAIWQDPAEADCVGMLIIKGQQLLREISSSGRSQDLNWTAIPCIEAAQAYALREAAGEPDRRH